MPPSLSPVSLNAFSPRCLWVRALLYGFLFGGSLLLAVPRSPYTGLLLLGIYLALFLGSAPRAYLVALGVGVTLYLLAGRRLAHALPDPVGFVSLLLPAAGVFLGGTLRRHFSPRLLTRVLLGALCLLFLIQGALSFPGSLTREPRAETYDYDPYFFLRVFYLEDAEHLSYYEAAGQAMIDDARFETPHANLAGWRTPVLTGLWSALFSSGGQIMVAFLLLSGAAMVGGYVLATRLSDRTTALVVPAMFAQYYLASLSTLHCLSYEVWAGFFALGAALLWYARRDKAGLACAFAAAAIREWFVSALIGGLACHLRGRRFREAALWGGALLLVLGIYALNLFLAWRYLEGAGVEATTGTAGRLGQGGPLFILYTLQFNAAFWVHEYVFPYLVFFLGLLGSAALIRRQEYFLPSLILVPLLFFLVTGSGHRPGDPYGMDVYYSGAFLPFLMIAACVAGEVFRRRSAAPAVVTSRQTGG